MEIKLDAKLRTLIVLPVFAFFLLVSGIVQATAPDSNCLIAHDFPGCDDAECETIVCDFDNFCCGNESGTWDSICADEAIEMCTLEEAPTGGCCLCSGFDQYMTIDTEANCTDLGGSYLGDGLGNTVLESTPEIAIPDYNAVGVSDTITVTESFQIGDLNVGLTITHSYVGDLSVTLSKAGGPSVELIANPPGCGYDNFNGIILDDEGLGGSIQAVCENNLSSPPNFVPANPLNGFDGIDSAGDWTLTVRDLVGSDTGVFVSWSLNFIPTPSPCAEAFPDQCQASEVRLFGTTGYGYTPSTLVELDPETGAILQTIGPVGYTVNGLAYDATTDTLYGGTSYNDQNFNGLIEIDRETGAGSPAGVNYWGDSAAVPVTNITVNSAGQMYGWSEWCDCLVSINKTTGVATEVGPSSSWTAQNGLSFDNSDVLYLVNMSDIYQINTGTGEAFYEGSLNVDAAHHGDFHPVSGLYYGLSYIWGDPTRSLLSCDLATQLCTTVGDPISALHTLAFAAEGAPVDNHPPVANAGPDQPVTITHDGDPSSGTASVTLDGSASSDPDGDVLEYSWKVGSVEIATGVNPTVDLATGEYDIILTVTDPDGATSSDTVNVSVTESNAAPVANAGTDQEVTSAGGIATVTLNGSASSDPDGDPLTYAWSASGTVIATGVSPTVSLAEGTHVITLSATDTYGAVDTDEVTVTVSPPAVVSALDVTVVKVVRRNAKVITVTMKITNPDDTTALNVTVTGGTLDGSDTNSPLPLVFGAIKPGKSKQCTLQFKNVPAGEQDLTVEGTSSLGNFFTQTSVIVP